MRFFTTSPPPHHVTCSLLASFCSSLPHFVILIFTLLSTSMKINTWKAWVVKISALGGVLGGAEYRH